MSVPTSPFSLMRKIYKQVMPDVHAELRYWKERAEQIPNEELRTQALASIEHKTFHCEGGGILGLIAEEHRRKCIRFIVAYQTISDYLDNLCDRSTSLDPADFAALHESMPHALQLQSEPTNYYRYREDQDDGGYLADLVDTCQEVLRETSHYDKIAPTLQEFAGYYCDLQIHKHVKVEEREERLINWFNEHKSKLPTMEWYEFSACSGSTLGIFCLVAYSFRDTLTTKQVECIREGYFPYVQGLHILLDYFIDQEEDKIGGDLNFCTYYRDNDETVARLQHFLLKADEHIAGIPHGKFHGLVNRGLVGVYLSDSKMLEQKELQPHAKKMVRSGGFTSRFFYFNGKMYRKLSKHG